MKKILILIKNNQFILNEGDFFHIPYIKGLTSGNIVFFKKIMLFEDDKKFILGNPWLDTYKFQAFCKVISNNQERGIVIKRNRRKNFSKKLGFKVKTLKINVFLIKKVI